MHQHHQEQQQQQQAQRDGNVDELATRLDRMNVELSQQNRGKSLASQQNAFQAQDVNNMLGGGGGGHGDGDATQTAMDECSDTPTTDNNTAPNTNRGQKQRENMSNILIVTNLDSAVFNDKLVRAKFESLFTAYDASVTFRYLRSFRRVRLDFTSARLAESARLGLNNYKLGASKFRCYAAQIIRPNGRLRPDNQGADDDHDVDNNCQTYGNSFLSIPKPTKQFLISPPASPPVDWAPVTESSPCIDVHFISALANLVPGEVHEIHPASESQPAIFVEVCEEAQFGGDSAAPGTRCPRIPKTASPGARPAPLAAADQSDECYRMQS